MTDLEARTRYNDYSEEDVKKGLLTLAACSGSAKTASEALAASGLEVPPGTLRSWKQRYHVEYAELHERHKHQIENAAILGLREILPAYAEAKQLALQKTIEALEDGKIDPSAALQRIATTMGIDVDKLRLMTDRSTSNLEIRTTEDAIEDLVRKGKVINTTAEELDD